MVRRERGALVVRLSSTGSAGLASPIRVATSTSAAAIVPSLVHAESHAQRRGQGLPEGAGGLSDAAEIEGANAPQRNSQACMFQTTLSSIGPTSNPLRAELMAQG